MGVTRRGNLRKVGVVIERLMLVGMALPLVSCAQFVSKNKSHMGGGTVEINGAEVRSIRSLRSLRYFRKWMGLLKSWWIFS